jgi:hypothetical protein
VAFKGEGVSLLRLVDEELDVMPVRLLLCTVLSRSVSVPLVEVLDKGAMSLALSAGACPHHMWQATVMARREPF